jgi:hypothetical protein
MIPLALVLTALPPLTKTQTTWKAHALEAGERLQAANNPCEKALQTAFVLHVTKPELVQKQNPKAEFMHVVLTTGKDDAFDLAYVYDRSKDELVGARLTSLPKQWVIAFADADKLLVSDNKGCVYELDTKKPFAATAFTQTPK